MKIKELPHGTSLRTKWRKIRQDPHVPAWDRFEPFYEWAISQHYGPGLGITRSNLDVPWGPGNCLVIPVQVPSAENYSRAEQWDLAVADFRRRLAWAEVHNPAAIARLLRNGVPAAKKAAPGTGTSESGAGQITTC